MEVTIPNSQNSYVKISTLGVFIITMLCCMNVLYFVGQAVNPLIQSDAWYFLDTNIRKWISHGFNWSDLFVKRGLVDHAQPLNKFFLYINYRFLNLDFAFEALVGLTGYFSIILFFLYHFISKLLNGATTAQNTIAFLMALLVFTSLNATGLYTWSLVTFSFLPLFIAFSCGWLSWHFLHKKNVTVCILFFLLSTLAIGDTASIILWATIATTIVITSFSKDSEFFKRGALWIFIAGLFIVSIFLIINWNFLLNKTNTSAAKETQLHLTDPSFYLESIRIIFSSSIIHGTHLSHLGSTSKFLSWLIALPLLFFYLKHFFDLIKNRKSLNEMDFIISFILIYASISIVAIIVGRVSEYGITYLNQPRYLVIYQLIPFSLFLKWAFSDTSDKERRQKISFSVVSVTLFIFLSLVELKESVSAYRAVPWMWKWSIDQTKVISNYLNNPNLPAGNCTPHAIPICGLSKEKRNELLKILRDNKLNIFSWNFQNKYRLFLMPAANDENCDKP